MIDIGEPIKYMRFDTIHQGNHVREIVDRFGLYSDLTYTHCAIEWWLDDAIDDYQEEHLLYD